MPSLASKRERVGRGEIRFKKASRPGRDSANLGSLVVTGAWCLDSVSTRFVDRISPARASLALTPERPSVASGSRGFESFRLPNLVTAVDASSFDRPSGRIEYLLPLWVHSRPSRETFVRSGRRYDHRRLRRGRNFSGRLFLTG